MFGLVETVQERFPPYCARSVLGVVLRAPYNRIVGLLIGDRPWPRAVETAFT